MEGWIWRRAEGVQKGGNSSSLWLDTLQLFKVHVGGRTLIPISL